MGKALNSTARLQELGRTISSDKIQRIKPLRLQVSTSQRPNPKLNMESCEKEQNRIPLAKVVSDCVNRWFKDTLKEAKAGDSAMQVLVGQMYNSGYGVPRDTRMGQAWINKASMRRSSALEVCDKHPGYNASDSDSDELEG